VIYPPLLNNFHPQHLQDGGVFPLHQIN
jgi:hypothetical protein